MDIAQADLTADDATTGRLIAAADWPVTPLGPMRDWAAHVRAAVGLLIESTVPMASLWGPAGVLIYNDAYARFAFPQHQARLGGNGLLDCPDLADLHHRLRRDGLAGRACSLRNEPVLVFVGPPINLPAHPARR